MDTNTKMKMEKVLNYTKNIVLSFVVLFTGLFLFPVIGVLILELIFGKTGFGRPDDYWVLITLTPTSAHSWLILLSHELAIFWPFVAFIIWAVRDSRKFKSQGVNTNPFLWGVGMIFPLILIVFPLYYIRRNITWLKEREKIISANESSSGLRGWYNRTNSITQNTKMGINNGLNVLKWTAVILAVSFVLLVIARTTHFVETKKTDEQVAKIHATKLTMDDVMGVNLPPDPGTEVDKTIAGIDANKNGIRDDVELAIFKEYPNSAKTRAVLLQYALALQMEMTLPILNKETATAMVEDNESRALKCIWSISSRDDMDKFTKETDKNEAFVKERQINTESRKKYTHDFYKYVGSYSMSRGLCDIELNSLPN